MFDGWELRNRSALRWAFEDSSSNASRLLTATGRDARAALQRRALANGPASIASKPKGRAAAERRLSPLWRRKQRVTILAPGNLLCSSSSPRASALPTLPLPYWRCPFEFLFQSATIANHFAHKICRPSGASGFQFTGSPISQSTCTLLMRRFLKVDDPWTL